MRNLILKYFLVNFPSSGMFLERETWATSSQRGRRSPQRCKRALTRPPILGGFLLRGLRLFMLMILDSLMMIAYLMIQVKTPIDYHYQRYQHQVKDVRVPENLQRAMAAEAEAARNARAKVIRIKMMMMMMIIRIK